VGKGVRVWVWVWIWVWIWGGGGVSVGVLLHICTHGTYTHKLSLCMDNIQHTPWITYIKYTIAVHACDH
jgi:hypothetical protein